MHAQKIYSPLSEDELEEVLIEIRSNGGSDDPLFSWQEGEINGEKNCTGIYQSV